MNKTCLRRREKTNGLLYAKGKKVHLHCYNKGLNVNDTISVCLEGIMSCSLFRAVSVCSVKNKNNLGRQEVERKGRHTKKNKMQQQ